MVICEQSDKSLKVYSLSKTFEAPLSDNYVVNTAYEVLTPDAKSQKVAIRFSSELKWLNKPWAGVDFVENEFKKGFEANSTFSKKWQRSKVSKYKLG